MKSLGKAKDSHKLAEYVAQAIVRELCNQTTEEAVVAYFVIHKSDDRDADLRQVWRYWQGELVEGTPDMLEKALGAERSFWPSLTFIFTIEDEKAEQARINIETYYDRGISEMSRGGHAQEWEMEKQSGEWTVVRKQAYRFWD